MGELSSEIGPGWWGRAIPRLMGWELDVTRVLPHPGRVMSEC